MLTLVHGEVVEVEVREYTRQDGTKGSAFDAFLKPDNPRYAADRISGPGELAPKQGDTVTFKASIRPKISKQGNPYLSIWCYEHNN